MANSLQDQLMGAGLIDSKKAKKISKESRKQKKVQKKSKDNSLNEAQLAAQKVQQEKLKRDQALNQQRNAEAEKKSLVAQINQLVNHYKLDRKKGDTDYNFNDNAVIKKILVSSDIANEIARGRLCVVRTGETYEVIPKPIADKIRERDSEIVVVYNKKPSTDSTASTSTDSNNNAEQSDDDYYAQFEIPDDLVW